MKKILFVASLSLLLGACQEKKTSAQKTTQENAKVSLTYSNLVDTATREEVGRALEAAGISPLNTASFLESVSLFNRTVGTQAGLVKEGFTTIDSLLPKYDEVAIQSIWGKQYPMFQGYNCRLTAFTLLRDLIVFPTVPEQGTKGESEVLFIDQESLSNAPKKLFTPEEESCFFTLFRELPTIDTKDVNVHLQTLQRSWKERGITFRYPQDHSKASLISVVFHSQISPEENFLFVGHVGVLLPFEDGLLFVEKLAFQEPYQVIKFANRGAVSDYLMNRYDVEWEQPTAIPFVMENDQLIEGYRPNPYKRR